MLVRMNKKRADTTEVILAVTLAVLVTYFILNLFSTNINTLVNNSGIHKLLFKNNADNKTSFSKMDTDPTKTEVNVQMVADQADLARYHNEAAGVIEDIALESEGGNIDEQEKIRLAKFLTIYAESGNTGATTLLEEKHDDDYLKGMSYGQLGRQNGVNIYPQAGNYYTTVGTQRIDWNYKYNPYVDKANLTAAMNSQDQTVRVQNVETIQDIFNHS